MNAVTAGRSSQGIFVVWSLLGDAAVTYLAMSFAYWLRFETALQHVGVPAEGVYYTLYIPLLLLGTLFLLMTFGYLGLYEENELLHLYRTHSIIIKGCIFWFFAYLGISLTLKIEPDISRIFATLALVTSILFLSAWRKGLHKLLTRRPFLAKLQKRVAILGINDRAVQLFNAMSRDANHPYSPIGVIGRRKTEAKRPPLDSEARILGFDDQLEDLIAEHRIEVLIICSSHISRGQTLKLASICERLYVTFKIAPGSFQVFLSGLNLHTISGIPILGIGGLPLDNFGNRLLKRFVDVTGSLAGLILSIPVMLILAIFIKRESEGPIMYRQVRTGKGGERFKIYKLRSMREDAEGREGARWAIKNDPRRTRIGAFMRRTNLDELPQFWNVLKGEMSLVGPRPERPELISSFQYEIQHYQTRHSIKPGITGWAQLHGLRGNTSLDRRIRYDLFYIENWSLRIDAHILIMTFFKRMNAY